MSKELDGQDFICISCNKQHPHDAAEIVFPFDDGSVLAVCPICAGAAERAGIDLDYSEPDVFIEFGKTMPDYQ